MPARIPVLGALLISCAIPGSAAEGPARGVVQGAVQGMALTLPRLPAGAPPPPPERPAPARPSPSRAEAAPPPAGRLPGQLTGRMRERVVRDICIGCDAP
ncbi:hypothetical protein [Methylobacterium nigriterrae]|uniref:hypothetical protein n=1 Tax=Methylobacterium nigriterrae TaxID=3127512 RepID=UPI0030133779